MEEHTRQVRLVLAKLREHGLYAKSEKCEFDRTSIEFLGYIISPTGITMDMKVSVIHAWATPRRLKDMQSFLGFANFYRRIIKGFSTLAQPLIALTRKGTPLFLWTLETQNAFDSLKHAFITAMVLPHSILG